MHIGGNMEEHTMVESDADLDIEVKVSDCRYCTNCGCIDNAEVTPNETCCRCGSMVH